MFLDVVFSCRLCGKWLILTVLVKIYAGSVYGGGLFLSSHRATFKVLYHRKCLDNRCSIQMNCWF